MTAFMEIGNRELIWISPHAPHEAFVLRAAGREIGRLSFADEAGVKATGEIEGHRWNFERTAFPEACITIRQDGSSDPAAVFSACVVAFASGVSYRWTRRGLLHGRHCFRRQDGKSSVCVSQQAGPLLSGGKVEICCDAARSPETPLLVLLAWYLRVLAFEKLAEAVVCA